MVRLGVKPSVNFVLFITMVSRSGSASPSHRQQSYHLVGCLRFAHRVYFCGHHLGGSAWLGAHCHRLRQQPLSQARGSSVTPFSLAHAGPASSWARAVHRAWLRLLHVRSNLVYSRKLTTQPTHRQVFVLLPFDTLPWLPSGQQPPYVQRNRTS